MIHNLSDLLSKILLQPTNIVILSLITFAAIVAFGLLILAVLQIVNRDEKLRASESRYRAIVDTQYMLIARMNPDGRLVFTNGAYNTYAGRSAEDLIDYEHSALIYEEDSEQWERSLALLTPERPDGSHEARWVLPDKTICWLHWNISARFINDGPLEEYQIVGVDITERKAAEDTLWESEHRYRALFDNANDAIFLLGLEGNHLTANQRAADMLEYTIDEIVELSYRDIVVPDEHPSSTNALKALLNGETLPIYERTFRKKNGRHMPVEINVVLVRDREDSPLYIQSIVRDITHRRHAENILKEREARLQAIVDMAADGIITFDKQEQILSFNRAAERIFGCDAVDVLGQQLTTIIPSHNDADTESLVNRLMKQDSRLIPGKEREIAGLRKDKSVFPIIVSLSEVPLADGNIFTAIIRDITNRKRMEEAERQQRALAEALWKSALVLSSTLDLDEVLKHILSNVEQVVPYDTASVTLIDGQEVRVLSTNLDAEAVPESASPEQRLTINHSHIVRQILKTGEPIIIDDLREQPEAITQWVEQIIPEGRSYIGSPIGKGQKLIGCLSLISRQSNFYTVEHTERLKAFTAQATLSIENARLYTELERYSNILIQAVEDRATELKFTQDRVEVILNNSPDAILVLAKDNTIQTANRAFKRLLGYSFNDMFGMPPDSLIIPEHADLLLRHLSKVKQAQEQGRVELVARHKNGTTFDVDIAMSPIVEKNDLYGMICSFRDISKLKEVERMKDVFVSNVSHELRTPITSLKLFANLLEKTPPEEQEELVEFLKREADRLHRIVEDVLRLSRLDQGRVEIHHKMVDLNELVKDYVHDRSLIAASRNLHLSADLQPDLPLLYTDEGLLSQVLNVLLTNAINYTPGGGSIETSTRLQDMKGAPWVGFMVKDSGHGISVEEQKRLYERFFRGKVGRDSGEPGTGLGLAIAKEIVDRLGGRIEVESEGVSDRGTIFRVWLPA